MRLKEKIQRLPEKLDRRQPFLVCELGEFPLVGERDARRERDLHQVPFVGSVIMRRLQADRVFLRLSCPSVSVLFRHRQSELFSSGFLPACKQTCSLQCRTLFMHE